MQTLGQSVLYLAFLCSLAGGLLGCLGAALRKPSWMRAARLCLYSLLAFYAVASVALVYSLLTHDFSNKYVATYTDVGMPVAYVFAAFWGGEKGALLFWVLVLTAFSSIAVHKNRNREPIYISCATGILMLAIFFFNLLMVFESSPFESFLTFDGPSDGKGMNPLLQNPVMTIHPPCMLTGYIAFTIPFAFGLSALLTKKLDDDWAKDTRVWTIVSWLFLTTGLILGGMWAYEELGWGGYWAWDPVENAGLIPWFTGTAFLHSVMIQERRGMLRRWNFFLVLLTFLLTIFGTFLTRSQLIDSIHAFADSTLAEYFLWYMLVIIVVSAIALATRWRDMAPEARIEHFLSRESFFVLNNLFLLGCAFVVLWGTVFSKVSELQQVQALYNALVAGYNATPLSTWFGEAESIEQAIVLGEAWFNRVMVPLGLILLLLTGIGPVISWRRATLKNFNKNMRGPLLTSLTVTTLGGVAWAVRRVFAVKAENLSLLEESHVHEVAAATAKGLEAPAMPDYGLMDAFGAWSQSLSSLDVYAFLCFLFSAFVVTTVGLEFYRGASILARKHGGGVLWNMGLLTMKNRRRYGGYIIHIGVVFVFLAFSGAVFKSENPESVLYPGEQTSISRYHLTLTALGETYVEDGAYVATRAPLVVMRDGTTVRHAEVDKLAERLTGMGLKGFQLETHLNRPVITVTLPASGVSLQQMRQQVFLDGFFRETFALVATDEASRTASFRLRDGEVVRIIPPALHRNLNVVRDEFEKAGAPIEVVTRPGNPVFDLKFGSQESMATFLGQYDKENPFKEAMSVRWGGQANQFEVIPTGVGHILNPEVRAYRKHSSPTTEVAIWSLPYEDVYIAMRPAMGQPFVNMLVVVFPLVSLLWTGALVMIFGGVVCLLPTEVAGNLFRAPMAPVPGMMSVIGIPGLGAGEEQGSSADEEKDS